MNLILQVRTQEATGFRNTPRDVVGHGQLQGQRVGPTWRSRDVTISQKGPGVGLGNLTARARLLGLLYDTVFV